MNLKKKTKNMVASFLTKSHTNDKEYQDKTFHIRCNNSFQMLSMFHTSEIWVPCVVVAFTFACRNAGK